MAITVIATAEDNLSTGSVLTITHGFTILSGDVIFAWLGKDNDLGGDWTCDNETFVNLSNQNTTAGRNLNSGVLRRVCDGGEPAALEFSTTHGEQKYGLLIQLRGVDNTTPEDVTLDHSTGTNDGTPDSQSITPANDGCEILYGAFISGASGMTLNQVSGTDGIVTTGNVSGFGIQLSYELQASAAATGLQTHPNTPDNSSSEWHVITVAVRPAAVGPVTGIQHDANSDGEHTSGSTFSWTHTVGDNTDGLVLIGVAWRNTGTDAYVVTGVTYDGNACTLIRHDEHITGDSQSISTGLYYYLAPDTGANTIEVTLDGAPFVALGGAVSLINVHQSDPIGADNGQAGQTGTSPSTNLTTLFDNSWIFDTLGSRNPTGSPSVGALQTERFNRRDGTSIEILGSTEPTTTLGSHTMSWTLGGSQRWSHSLAEIREAPSGIVLPIFSDQGIHSLIFGGQVMR